MSGKGRKPREVSLPRLASRRMARARHEDGVGASEIVSRCINEIMRLFRDGRVPNEQALQATQAVESELYDRMAAESLTFAESLQPWHGGDRGRMDD